MKKFSTLMKNSTFKSGLCVVFALFIVMNYLSPARADSSITSGTTLRVAAGTTLVNVGVLTIKSGGAITNLGTINVSGNLDNQNTAVSDLGAGTFLLNGAVLQNVNGKNTFGNLTINNAAGVSLNGNTVVNGVLNLTAGRVALSANNLLLGTSATVAGSPSASAMVVATGTGEFRKSFSGAGSFTYPVGDNTVTAEYSPVTLAFTGGSYGSGNYAGVNLVNTQYPGSPVTGSFLNRYWNVTQSNITGFSCNATFKYVAPADVTGTESLIYCTQITPTVVAYYSAANTSLHQLTANGLTSFGAFTGLQQLANKSLNVSLLIQGIYNGAGTMRKAQGAAGDQFPGNTADQVTIELHNQANYSNIIYSTGLINVSTSGVGSVASTPGIYNGSYYVTIKHRNSIETTSASPVSFSGSSIAYNFNTPAKAYGGNLGLMIDGYYVIFGGDVNRDGGVDTGDMTPVDNSATNYETGYLVTDANGDGSVDTGDMTIVDNNAGAYVSSLTP
jgi:hypothetical protein